MTDLHSQFLQHHQQQRHQQQQQQQQQQQFTQQQPLQHPQQFNNPYTPKAATSVATNNETLNIDPNDPLATIMPSNPSHNIFNDNISSFFAPYGIDVSHFPLTNPPIFESALYAVGDDTDPRSRRRISISNGQIGQIINNHTLSNDDIYDIQPPPYPNRFVNPQLHHQQQQPPPPPQQTSNGEQGSLVNGDSHNNLIIPPHHENSFAAQPLRQPPSSQQQQQPEQQQIQPSLAQPPLQPVIVKAETPLAGSQFPQTNNQGIPNHKLVYNNEIIFNPDAGPIPGTSAWKKARLLERNRIAASKCRQRKKAAQIQLKEDVLKFEKEIDDLRRENSLLIELYQVVKQKEEKDANGGDETLKVLLKKISDELAKEQAKDEAEEAHRGGDQARGY